MDSLRDDAYLCPWPVCQRQAPCRRRRALLIERTVGDVAVDQIFARVFDDPEVDDVAQLCLAVALQADVVTANHVSAGLGTADEDAGVVPRYDVAGAVVLPAHDVLPGTTLNDDSILIADGHRPGGVSADEVAQELVPCCAVPIDAYAEEGVPRDDVALARSGPTDQVVLGAGCHPYPLELIGDGLSAGPIQSYDVALNPVRSE